MILVTSIPPRISRVDAQGCEIGETYQAACINSWIHAGFEPVSVNAIAELPTSYGVSESNQVRTVSTPRDARNITNRPLVFLSDLLNAAAIESRGTPFALTNADIMLTPTSDLAARVSRLCRGELLFSRRIDIDTPENRSGIAYHYGYDFFAAHPDDVSRLMDSSMVLGAPWWDHYFPLAMLAQGCRIQQMTEPFAFHLNHEERWSCHLFEALGSRFVVEIAKYSLPEAYKWQLSSVVNSTSRHWLSELKQMIRGTQDAIPKLDHLLNANVAFLDRMSLVGE